MTDIDESILWTPNAEADLAARLEYLTDESVRETIAKTIRDHAKQAFIRSDSRIVVPEFDDSGLLEYRCMQYRVLFEMEDEKLRVLAIYEKWDEVSSDPRKRTSRIAPMKRVSAKELRIDPDGIARDRDGLFTGYAYHVAANHVVEVREYKDGVETGPRQEPSLGFDLGRMHVTAACPGLEGKGEPDSPLTLDGIPFDGVLYSIPKRHCEMEGVVKQGVLLLKTCWHSMGALAHFSDRRHLTDAGASVEAKFDPYGLCTYLRLRRDHDVNFSIRFDGEGRLCEIASAGDYFSNRNEKLMQPPFPIPHSPQDLREFRTSPMLDLGGETVTDSVFEELMADDGLNALQVLRLNDAALSPGMIERLGAVSRLESLFVWDEGEKTRESCRSLKAAHPLLHLTYNGRSLVPAALQEIPMQAVPIVDSDGNPLPRVHAKNIEYRDTPDPWDEDEIAYYEGELFTGVICSELRGSVSEESVKEGEPFGIVRCYYPDGSLLREVSHRESSTGECKEWWPSGQLKEHSWPVEGESLRCRRKWDESGVLIEEYRSDLDELRRWYPTGLLSYERTEGNETYFSKKGDWLFRPRCENHKTASWNDEAMAESFMDLAGIQRIERSLNAWALATLDANRAKGVSVLRQLLGSEDARVIRRTLHSVKERQLVEVIDAVEDLVESPRFPRTREMGSDDPVWVLASEALLYLRATDDEARSLGLAEIRKRAVQLERAKRQAREGDNSSWCRHPLSAWKRAEATLVESMEGSLTTRTAANLLDPDPPAERFDYWDIFEFQCDGKTFRHVRIESKPSWLELGHSQSVLFDPEEPSESTLVSAFGNYCISRGGYWDFFFRANAAIRSTEWLDLIAGDPSLTLLEDCFAEWSGEEGAWFDWADGYVFSRNVSQPAGLAKAREIASKLNARVWSRGQVED